MARFKNCHEAHTVKNRCVRNKQRYQGKDCGYNFVVGDDRMKAETAVKRAFSVILYALGKTSYGFIAKLFGVTPPAVPKNGCNSRRICLMNLRFREPFGKWNLIGCGISSDQKKQKVDHQSPGSCFKANRGLGYRWS